MIEDLSTYLVVDRASGLVVTITVGRVERVGHDTVLQDEALELVGIGCVRQSDGSFIRPPELDLPIAVYEEVTGGQTSAGLLAQIEELESRVQALDTSRGDGA